MSRTEIWNAAYDNDTAPWVIGEPQPAIVALERTGAISGRVLEPGCGAGEHTILLTTLGYDVRGVDLSPSAIEYARANAQAQGVPNADFQVADALEFATRPDFAGDPPGSSPAFDTIVDSALFHVFGADPETRAAYVRNLHAVCKPGGVVFVLALSDAEPGFGPRISDSVIRESFGAGWELEELRPDRYRGRVTASVAEAAAGLEVSADGLVDLAAWIARIRRL
ncbi:methyltransferase domain-containing protein [Nocardia sp. SYP-A9097]|uniref:methyltransferase domain-containing protein n=1 Tax=Nocardia sp. SYP-A9097 TaxID=2663237 RepID=UPI00129ADBFE|nr:methyltransferase domain-containing protein [Nocardia sp. SYP-A9097]MRH91738.1 methyltransferase domain-containing protein [Nocardia sp. SYP-A9097]